MFLQLCHGSSVIGSLEIQQIDPLSYDAANIDNNNILVNYDRFSCGLNQWGAEFSSDTNNFGRLWQSDADFRSPNTKASINSVSIRETITNTNQPPNYYPMKLYQTAIVSSGVIEYDLTVDEKLDYLILFHFAEIDSSVTKAGQSVIDLVVNEKNVSRLDTFEVAGSFAAYSWHYVVKNLATLS